MGGYQAHHLGLSPTTSGYFCTQAWMIAAQVKGVEEPPAWLAPAPRCQCAGEPAAAGQVLQHHYQHTMYHRYISTADRIILAAVVQERGLQDNRIIATILANCSIHGQAMPPVLPGHCSEHFIRGGAQDRTGLGHLTVAHPAQQGRE
jgi:hypothetical protein